MKHWGIKYFSVAVFLLTVASVIILFYSHKNSKSAITGDLYNSETELAKAKQLKKMNDTYFLKSAFGLILGAIAIFVHLTVSKPTAMGIFLGMLSVMAFVFYWNVFVKKKVFL